MKVSQIILVSLSLAVAAGILAARPAAADQAIDAVATGPYVATESAISQASKRCNAADDCVSATTTKCRKFLGVCFQTGGN